MNGRTLKQFTKKVTSTVCKTKQWKRVYGYRAADSNESWYFQSMLQNEPIRHFTKYTHNSSALNDTRVQLTGQRVSLASGLKYFYTYSNAWRWGGARQGVARTNRAQHIWCYSFGKHAAFWFRVRARPHT